MPATANNIYEPKEYTSFYNLTDEAFSKSIALDHLYQTVNFTDVQQRLITTVKCNYVTLLVGQPGTGKSTALRYFVNNLDKSKYEVIYISESQLTPRWLYTIPLVQLGCSPSTSRVNNKRMLHEQINAIGNNGRKVVFIVDEAHHMTRWNSGAKGNEGLEELRFLLNDNYDQDNPMSLILAGQTELLDLVGHKTSTAVAQRVNLLATCKPLTADETANYILKRLQAVGYNSAAPLFTQEALNLIALASGGIARIINTICSVTLYFAAHEKCKIIDYDMTKLIIDNEILRSVLSPDYS